MRRRGPEISNHRWSKIALQGYLASYQGAEYEHNPYSFHDRGHTASNAWFHGWRTHQAVKDIFAQAYKRARKIPI